MEIQAYEVSNLLESFVKLREILCIEDTLQNIPLLKLTDENLENLLKQTKELNVNPNNY